jgi:8-oxo-dGTP pyrophosphatase MutT (NUDIX family)
MVEQADRRDFWAPHVTVTAVIEQDGRYLMVEERARGQIVFNQPSGHLDSGESILEAVRREVLEETRRLFEPTHLLGQYLWRRPGGDSFLRTVLIGEAGEEDLSLPMDESIIDTHWFSLEELEARQDALRSPLVLAAVHDHRAGVRHPIDILRHVDAPPTIR